MGGNNYLKHSEHLKSSIVVFTEHVGYAPYPTRREKHRLNTAEFGGGEAGTQWWERQARTRMTLL